MKESLIQVYKRFIAKYEEKIKESGGIIYRFNDYILKLLKTYIIIKHGTRNAKICIDKKAIIMNIKNSFKRNSRIKGRIVKKKKNYIIFYRGKKYFNVRRKKDRVKYRNYEDWKLIQTWKGRTNEFHNLWEATKAKQIKNWNFVGISKKDIVLDVGFRDGYNLRYLQQKGYLIEGIDINPIAIKAAINLGCKVYEEDIQKKTHFKDNTFDIIIVSDVLEHCYSPESALKEMHRILKENGRVMIEIPFERKFDRNLLHGHSFFVKNEKKFENLVNSIDFFIDKRDTRDKTKNLFVLKKKQTISKDLDVRIRLN